MFSTEITIIWPMILLILALIFILFFISTEANLFVIRAIDEIMQNGYGITENGSDQTNVKWQTANYGLVEKREINQIDRYHIPLHDVLGFDATLFNMGYKLYAPQRHDILLTKTYSEQFLDWINVKVQE